MKKLLLFVFIFSCMAVTYTANAQLSQGGTPYSFSHTESKSALNMVTMPAFDLEALKAQDAINDQSKGPFRFGYNHFVNLNMNNSGTWTTLANGDRLYRLSIKCPNAQSVNIAFDDFYMPAGATLFIYNGSEDYVIGAFTSVNNQDDKAFATDLIPGEQIVLEYFEPAAVANQGRMNIFRVTHGYRGILDYEKNFGGSGSCQVNVNCPVGANWQSDKHSVVCLVSGGNEFCTGALVNDVPQDGKPYILTANHCGSSGFNTWVFRFNWEASGCTNPGSSPSTAQSLTGGIQRAASANSDFSLVEITGGLSGGTIPASYGTYFSGWSNVNTPATSATCIHHPSGDIKKISFTNGACVSDTWTGTPANSHWKAIWTTACTEPGSSGSPLYDQNHRIVGQLHGGPSACGQSAANMNDVYGKFSMSWLGGGTNATQLKHWLDPNGTNTTGTLDGWNPSATVGINQIIDNATAFTIYPNPSTGEFQISNFKLQTTDLKVVNILGETVFQSTISASTSSATSQSTINISGLANGMYFVRLTDADNKVVYSQRVIKQ